MTDKFDHVASFDKLPDTALVSLHTVVALASRSRASVYRDVEAGYLARPVRIGTYATKWRVSDVRAYLNGTKE
jgi:predicted DNA-binding transcriptional regulator AlpA